MRHPNGRDGDATVIATLPNPPAEIIDAYSRKLSTSMTTAQAPVSPLVFVCVPTARRHTCKTMKGSLSFGAMPNVHAVNCSAFGSSALYVDYQHSVTRPGSNSEPQHFPLQSARNPRKPADCT